jgi:Methylamine utilisation protein MauE
VVTVLRLVVAGVLLAAAVSKLRDRAAVARRLGGRRTWLLVVVEGGLAIWLFGGFQPRLAGAAAVVLMGVFAAHLALARARGARALPCNCFGVGPDRPAWLLISRTLLLAAVAGVVALAPPTPPRDALLVAAMVVLAVAVAALAVLVLALYRQVGVLALRVAPRHALELAEEGPELGVAAPRLDGLERTGEELVAFLGVGCRVCHDLEPSLRALGREGLPVRLVYDVEDDAAMGRWRVPGTPFVVALGDGIAVAKGTVNTLEEIEGLLTLGRARLAHAAA